MIMDPDGSTTVSNEESKTSDKQTDSEACSSNSAEDKTIMNTVNENADVEEKSIDNSVRSEENESENCEINKLNEKEDVSKKPDTEGLIESGNNSEVPVNARTSTEECAMELEPIESGNISSADVDNASTTAEQHNCDSTILTEDKVPQDSVTLSNTDSGESEIEIAKENNNDPVVNPEVQTNQQNSVVCEESQTKEIPAKKLTSDTTKNVLEKNIVEPEKTEFVQFSQDKNDDSQSESQCMDAEDPFGGDNLNSESSEPMETDGLGDTSTGFSKLGDQADNLQSIIGSRESNFNVNEEVNCEKDTENPKNVETSEDITETTPQLPDATESGTETQDPKVDELSKKADNQTKDVPGEIVQMDTEEEQSNVLPGQDDELCIVPDTMKLIIPEKTGNKTSVNDTPHGKDETSKSSVETNKEKGDGPTEIENVLSNTSEKKDINNKTNAENSEKDQSVNNQISVDESSSTASAVTDVEQSDKTNDDIEEISAKEMCKQCKEVRSCKIRVNVGQESYNVCSKTCKALFKAANNRAMDIPSDGVNSKREKRCANCLLIIEPNDERNLSWETMEFCNEECLGKFQTKYGSYCRNCNGTVQAVSLGKYCVRFGYDVRQFCCSTCLEEFKKGLKVCSYCQKDISSCADGFLAPVGDRGQFKDFCTQECMEKYSKINSMEPAIKEKKCCSVCQEEKIVHCEVQLDRASPVAICGEPCFAAFKFVKKVDPDQCSTCKKFFELPNKKCFVVFFENEAHTFCSKTCLNVFITINRKIVPCNWCKVKKYNFDMIKKELKMGQVLMMCSLNCLTLYQVSINAVSARRINCDFCKEFSQAQYHLTMSDATIRNFCCYNCVMKFQAQYTKSPITIPTGDDPVPTSGPKRTIPKNTGQAGQKVNEMQSKKTMPVISSVTSLATMGNGQVSPTTQQTSVNNVVIPQSGISQNQAPQIIYKQQVITRPPSPVKVHNKITQCKPLTHTKGVSVRPHPCTKSTQTEGEKQAVVPIPVPIYVPFPVHMYSMPLPIPVPFPLPIPVPIFIPTTRNSAKGILKDIKRIQEKIPADPFEAELLMMAEMVATEKKATETDTDSGDDRDDDPGDRDNSHTGGFSPEGVDSSNTFGDDMLQMALKMATGELDEPAVDLEAALTPNTITATQTPTQSDATIDNDVQAERLIGSTRGRKRVVPYKPRSTPSKRGKRASGSNDLPLMPPPDTQPPPQPRIIEPIEKPDANMALKYTFGVNAWRQWVVSKNAELEKQSTPMRKLKLFKTDLLQLTADELNYSLCLFVKEVRKPNGSEYAPDTIYYLCLGIQQYLFENNRIDNIFTDPYYEKFTDCLNEVAKKFSVLYNDAQYIVTRVEEEHLWECKQLGAHSPHVLLSTLMFFNTKHFNLVSVEEHMQLSFSHIMKHWKRNPATQPTTVSGKVPGSRNVLLRFYPPQSALEGNSRKRKVYEQQENEENPLRCPVKLYEFYLSKCPESVKTRNDVFYLLPERSCVPDSPVWYSTSPLAKENLIKMLHRIKMVKEINVALLTS